MITKKYIFLILHYMNVQVTNSCIKSLLQLNAQSDIQIVVVDNGSNNGSGVALLREWSDYSEIDILILENNAGFSKGNNEGFAYIKKKYKCNFVIVMNSDVEIKDEDFCVKVEQIYNKKYFDILGPDIYQVCRGIHQNPEKMVIHNKEEAKREIEKDLKHCKYYIYYSLRYELRRRIQEFNKRKGIAKEKNINYTIEVDNIKSDMKLHGACIILATKFIENNNKVFEPETFLYCEEDILALRGKHEQYKILYSPELQVLHLGSASSKLFSIKGRKKFFERRVEALKIVEKYILENF